MFVLTSITKKAASVSRAAPLFWDFNSLQRWPPAFLLARAAEIGAQIDPPSVRNGAPKRDCFRVRSRQHNDNSNLRIDWFTRDLQKRKKPPWFPRAASRRTLEKFAL